MVRMYQSMYLTKLREIQAANTKKGWIVVGYNAIRFIPPNCSQLRCVQLGREKTLGSVPDVGCGQPANNLGQCYHIVLYIVTELCSFIQMQCDDR